MRVLWMVLRWVLIAVVTFSIASAATTIITLSLLQHGRHLHAWMVWAILAVSFLLVWATTRATAPPLPDLNTLRRHD